MLYILVNDFSPFYSIQLVAKLADINPNNVFLSGINGPSPVAKLGDLGNSKHVPDQTPLASAYCGSGGGGLQ